MWKSKENYKKNGDHRQSALFLKFVPTPHFSVILYLFVKVVSNLMIPRVPESVSVLVYMWELCFQVVLFKDGSLDCILVFSNQYGLFVIKFLLPFNISSAFFMVCHTFDSCKWNFTGMQSSSTLSTQTVCGDDRANMKKCDRNHKGHNPKIFALILLKAQSSGGGGWWARYKRQLQFLC